MTPIYATSTYVQTAPASIRALNIPDLKIQLVSRTSAASQILKADPVASHSHPGSPQCPPSWNFSIRAIMSSQATTLYGGTYRLFERVRKRSSGLNFTSSTCRTPLQSVTPSAKDADDLGRNSVNPLLKLIDLEAIGSIRKERGILAVADNTFASPYLQRPSSSDSTS